MQTGINPDKALRKKSATKLHRFARCGRPHRRDYHIAIPADRDWPGPPTL